MYVSWKRNWVKCKMSVLVGQCWMKLSRVNTCCEALIGLRWDIIIYLDGGSCRIWFVMITYWVVQCVICCRLGRTVCNPGCSLVDSRLIYVLSLCYMWLPCLPASDRFCSKVFQKKLRTCQDRHFSGDLNLMMLQVVCWSWSQLLLLVWFRVIIAGIANVCSEV